MVEASLCTPVCCGNSNRLCCMSRMFVFQVRIFKLLENCFSTPRALQSEFVDVEERKMILSMPPSELALRSAVNGLGFGLYQLQVPYENRTARFVTES